MYGCVDGINVMYRWCVHDVWKMLAELLMMQNELWRKMGYFWAGFTFAAGWLKGDACPI
jgi:predicted phosphoadenosine phosphosulfate sulfurtransferase